MHDYWLHGDQTENFRQLDTACEKKYNNNPSLTVDEPMSARIPRDNGISETVSKSV